MSRVPKYMRKSTVAFDEARERVLKKKESSTASKKNVVYWMSREQRVHDNWALLRAKALAESTGGLLSVAFSFDAERMTSRQYEFARRGLREVSEDLRERGIRFSVVSDVASYAAEHAAWCVVSDFSPLRASLEKRTEVARALPEDVEMRQVDAHNVVPVWFASDKQETGARTIRKKIETKLARFLTEFPEVGSQSGEDNLGQEDVEDYVVEIDDSVPPIDWCDPGECAAHSALEAFCTDGRLKTYADQRNNPNLEVLSNLSPYFHFGQLAPQRAALEVKKLSSSRSEGVKTFIEESVVRRELSDNFCFYQPRYDSLEGAAGWARDSLELHSQDKREHLYSRQQLEDALSHEDIWNAAQRQLVQTGKMHGFMRMYWCKKILEWTESPSEALATGIYLNDKYSIDGCDPNGYVGVGWSIMGIHDMGWAERPIFGKIRYMNYNGCKRKFDIKAYAAKFPPPPGQAGGPLDKFVTKRASPSKAQTTQSKKKSKKN